MNCRIRPNLAAATECVDNCDCVVILAKDQLPQILCCNEEVFERVKRILKCGQSHIHEGYPLLRLNHQYNIVNRLRREE